MRYLDIAVAALLGVSAITGLGLVSPRPGDAASVQLSTQTGLRDGLLAIVQHKGISWLLTTPAPEICAYLEQSSNSTVSLSATIGTEPCPSQPLPEADAATLYVPLKAIAVELEAWPSAQA